MALAEARSATNLNVVRDDLPDRGGGVELLRIEGQGFHLTSSGLSRGLSGKEYTRFTEWLLRLPPELEDRTWREIRAFEEDEQVTNITYDERIGLDLEFSESGASLLPEIEQVGAIETLRAIIAAQDSDDARWGARGLCAAVNRAPVLRKGSP
jgi:hypothetical protein